MVKHGYDQARKSPIQKKRSTFETYNPLIEDNLGSLQEPKITKVSGLITEKERDQLVELI